MNHRTNLYEALLKSKIPKQIDSLALSSDKSHLTYAALCDEIDQLGFTLRTLGIKKGDRVVLFLENSAEYIVSFMAIVSLGAVAVPVDVKSGVDRLRTIIDDIEPSLVIHSSTNKPQDSKLQLLMVPINKNQKEKNQIIEGSSDDDAAILFSAGSTGKPKGVVLKHKHFIAIASMLSELMKMNPQHKELVVSSLTHSGAWQRVTSTFLAGGCVRIPTGVLSPPKLLEEIQHHQINGFFAPPPILRVLLMVDEKKVQESTKSLTAIESASAPITAEELKKLMGIFPTANIYFQYGLTECSRALILETRAFPNKLHTVGKPTKGVQVKILDEMGNSLSASEEGEIFLKAPQLSLHYWKNEVLNKCQFKDGWLKTGDFGTLDDEGFLTYLGRRDDMINCGGHSYFPAEVEAVLGPLDGVSEYLIAGVPDTQGLLNDVPWAFVVPKDKNDWAPTFIFELAKKKLPPHMIPRHVVVIPEIPKTMSGKPNRLATVKEFGTSKKTG